MAEASLDLAPSFKRWDPTEWTVAPDWADLVSDFAASPTGRKLGDYLGQRLEAGAVIYPPRPLTALELTPRAKVRVVILGQDPYHGAGQAHGLAFSVAPGVRTPPSLRNIYKERQRDLGLAPPASGSLIPWALQGVLLLNTCLTVEDGSPGSHANRGWEVLTDAVVRHLGDSEQPVVFLLWGAHAQKKVALLEQAARRSLVLQANHPSPLSASRGPVPFLGCGHFSAANRWLVAQGCLPVEW